MEMALVIERWLHITVGIFWVGMLYYFNFVQMPAVTAANADKDGPGSAAIMKYIAPRALFWFRWASIVTWLGTILLFNVWGFIWPNQKKLLGLKPATDEQKVKAKKITLFVARTNVLLSIPLLYFMAAQTHGGF
ncbi:hypothetical protein MNBD_GAMMA25-1169 [hydrothermal vent metagenome]|uniref:Urate oxidase N-terminal domain-containing protein n=1 Tax=hydrothermal vent metagenome TaxID=652676 RepID=A0A3B1BKF8_9ZZZZ